jgi:TRAP transporter 4TM/12TM fusion protein
VGEKLIPPPGVALLFRILWLEINVTLQSMVGDKQSRFQVGRAAHMSKPVLWVYLGLVIVGLLIYLYYTFGPVRIGGKSLLLEQVPYFYLLFAVFGACVFLLLPARAADRNRIPWYDYTISAVMLGVCFYFSLHGDEIINVGWSPAPELRDQILAGVFCAIALESGRRLGGLAFFFICILAFVYPLFAQTLPGGFKGIGYSLDYIVSVMAFGRQGAIGMPAGVLGDVIIGFLIFCGVLLVTGAGDFFLNIAMSLFGRFRGGPAKVCVVASGLFGTVTGNPLAAALTIGGVTGSAMKRCGYSADHAGGILSCAALGTQIMPPVMGTIAFIMAVLINKSYTEIMVAAAIPAILYYYSLTLQVDAYAGRHGLKGLPVSELPSARKAIKTGWPFLIVLAFLVFGLIYMRWSGGQAGVYAAGLCLILSCIYKETRLSVKTIAPTIATIGTMIIQTVSVLLPSAFIIAGLQSTGTLGNAVSQVIGMAGGESFIILLVACLISFLFGMVGISLISYLVLAGTMAPALSQAIGMDIIGLHLFLAYFAIIGAITPPVAMVAFVSAAIVGAPPMKTAWTATKLGIVLYFLPFFFVYEPALLLHGDPWVSVIRTALCLVGIGILCAGIEGYLWWSGKVPGWARVPLILGGFGIAIPTDWAHSYIGFGAAAVAVVTIVALILLGRIKRKRLAGLKTG